MHLSAHREIWPLAKTFTITGFAYSEMDLTIVEITDGDLVGRGEAAGVDFLGEDGPSVFTAVDKFLSGAPSGFDRIELLELLPRGGARNAIDCALWDLEAKRAGCRAWEIAGLPANPIETVYTVGMDTPEAMASDALAAASFAKIKVKLSADDPIRHLRAVRTARPDAHLVVDANQAWSVPLLDRLLPDLVSLGVAMVEQPVPRGGDDDLIGFKSPIPLCGDEACLSIEELDRAQQRYQMINIKLDKAGGLTAALQLAHEARARGMGLMVGNMTGTSLAMAPAFLVAQLCDFADLDGPCLLRRDRAHPMHYIDGVVLPPSALLWG